MKQSFVLMVRKRVVGTVPKRPGWQKRLARAVAQATAKHGIPPTMMLAKHDPNAAYGVNENPTDAG